MARPADIPPLTTQVEVGTATGAQLQMHLEFLESIVVQADAYNATHEALGTELGDALSTGFLRVADDGVRATTTTDTPRSFNGVLAPFHIKDTANA